MTSFEENKKRLARWMMRFTYSNQYVNIIFRFVWLAMFCKIFNMPLLGYVLTGAGAVFTFIAVSWLLDRTGMIKESQRVIWERTPQWHEMKEMLRVESDEGRLGGPPDYILEDAAQAMADKLDKEIVDESGNESIGNHPNIQR